MDETVLPEMETELQLIRKFLSETLDVLEECNVEHSQEFLIGTGYGIISGISGIIGLETYDILNELLKLERKRENGI